VEGVDFGDGYFELTVDSEELEDEDKVHAHFGALIDQSLEDINALPLYILLQQHLLY
jgi:hypothetical protein